MKPTASDEKTMKFVRQMTEEKAKNSQENVNKSFSDYE